MLLYTALWKQLSGWKTRGPRNSILNTAPLSTLQKKGNIGPVADAIMEYLGETCTILCPALPVNGRIVRSGKLYVNGVPLDQSPMKNHPLTPMWDSRIKALIETQSKYHAYEWDTTDLNTKC